jgi:purine nucleosidase
MRCGICLLLALALFPALSTAAERVPILLDTDIGSDVDDAFAVALALAHPDIELVGVTTCGAGAEDRAWMVCRMLTAVGKREIPVAWGRDPQPEDAIEGQIQYRRHPAVIFNRTAKPITTRTGKDGPIKDEAVEFLYSRLKAQPGRITLVAVGPLTNVARLLQIHPDSKQLLQRLVIMGGSVRVGYDGKKSPEVEWNIKCDIPAARAVFASGVSLVVAPLDATGTLKLDEPLRKKLFATCTPLTFQVQALYQMWDKPTPVLFDPAAVALSVSEQHFTMEDLHLEVSDKGLTQIGKGKPNARVATAVKEAEFLTWYVERVASFGSPLLPKPPGNRSLLIQRGGLPNRVHCFEDYETDIEKRWWMSGKAETKDVPPGGGKRTCRSILTQDFDDLQGDTKTMYSAVIFNPVPGPPMGKNPRLSFRYKLLGTDTLRVQIYSLSKGYHRYLSLTGLPQDRWEWATVDMTQGRPDGTGGPLSENERIDDVQFYVDPRAEVLIDDMILYDAAVPGEKRPFPKSIQYTGVFDTGKQGKEWPGTFEIVEKDGYFWKAARSVPNPETGSHWIRLHLRGERPLGESAELFFRYRLTGEGDSIRVRLVNPKTRAVHEAVVSGLKKGEWAEATAAFAGVKRGEPVEEIHLLLPKGAELLIDDVLLYEPGQR